MARTRRRRSKKATKSGCKRAARQYSAAATRARNAKERMLKSCRTFGRSRQKRKSRAGSRNSYNYRRGVGMGSLWGDGDAY